MRENGRIHLTFGAELPHWKLADQQLKDHGELLILGGNRSGKTEYAAKRVVQALCANPNSIIWCFTATSQNSIAHQQAAVYRYLPNEYKTLGVAVLIMSAIQLKMDLLHPPLYYPTAANVCSEIGARIFRRLRVERLDAG